MARVRPATHAAQAATLCVQVAALWRRSGLLPETAAGCDASAEQARLLYTHTHTHTHTYYIYIHIYVCV